MDDRSVRELLDPAAFPHPAERIALRETYISWVILCGDFAYKIKKPVDFGYLDFSTPERRRHFCEEELRLNRRFAPELYLAVVPITREQDGLRIDGDGEVVEYAVRMRRFDESQLLDTIAAGGGLDRGLLRALGRELAGLSERLPTCRPDPGSSEPGTPGALLEAIEQNFAQVEQYPLAAPERSALEHVRAWSRWRYEELLPGLQRRVGEGRIIDGHGDAHLGNIALVEGAVRLFDCIEFNPAFRIIDSIGEIAFLSMDLDARGYGGAGHRLLTDYLEYCGDFDGLEFLDLYRAYFAMVRAKVGLLREDPNARGLAGTEGYADFHRYLDLASHYSHHRPRFLAITHGVSGSGKSTIAGTLVEDSGAVRLRSDVERKRLFGLGPEQRCTEAQRDELYSTAMSRATFERLEVLATTVLAAGYAVIVDATFLHRRVRQGFHALARELGVPYVILDCRAGPDELRRRLRAREQAGADASDADVAVMEAQQASLQPLSGRELDFRLEVGPAAPVETLWTRLKALYEL